MSKTITVGSADYQGSDNTVLQRAVDDAAARGGGVVEVPAGTYLMHDSLHLRSGVRVVGRDGPRLLKVPSITVQIADYLGYGHYEFTVAEPDLLRVGMGVSIADDNAFGFYETVATIIGRQGDLFFTDRMLNHDYDPGRNGRVTTIFPSVSGIGIVDSAIEGIAIDGNPEETCVLNGCRGGGVFLLQSQRVRVEGLAITGYKGDAISFQQCADIVVRGCHISGNSGTGMHPGSGSVRYVMEGNHVSGNGGYGVFYCLRTTHSICRGNHISGNGEAGISIGERDTDHLIEGNAITDNRRHGIEFRKPRFHGGDRVLVRGNAIARNCQGDVGCEIHLDSNLSDIHISGNAIKPGNGHGTVYVGPGCERISFSGNAVSGRAQRAEDILGERELVRLQPPDDEPTVGPEALPPDGARHLGREFTVDS